MEATGSPDSNGRSKTAPSLWLWLDPVSHCNLACALCYTRPMHAPRRMSLNTFIRVVSRLKSSDVRVSKIHLNWRGEPTLNRELPEMLSHLWQAAPEWPLEWHTNGTAITDRRARLLVAAHPGQTILVSLDGGNARAFEQNRGARTWNYALNGLEALLRAVGEYPGPVIGIYQLDLKVPPDEYDARFVALSQQVSRHIVVEPIALDGGRTEGHRDSVTVPHGPCFWMGHAFAVDCDGVAWTCLLPTGTRIGSLIDEEVDVLLSRAVAFRDRVAEGGRTVVPGCARCYKSEASAYAEQSNALLKPGVNHPRGAHLDGSFTPGEPVRISLH
jgi:Radical SAM superfamily